MNTVHEYLEAISSEVRSLSDSNDVIQVVQGVERIKTLARDCKVQFELGRLALPKPKTIEVEVKTPGVVLSTTAVVNEPEDDS